MLTLDVFKVVGFIYKSCCILVPETGHKPNSPLMVKPNVILPKKQQESVSDQSSTNRPGTNESGYFIVSTN